MKTIELKIIGTNAEHVELGIERPEQELIVASVNINHIVIVTANVTKQHNITVISLIDGNDIMTPISYSQVMTKIKQAK